MQLIVLLGAELDIQMAFNRFEEYREGFGLKFLQELELAYEYLRRHPRIGRLYANNRQRFLVPNFPFGIFYSVERQPNTYFGRFGSSAGSRKNP